MIWNCDPWSEVLGKLGGISHCFIAPTPVFGSTLTLGEVSALLREISRGSPKLWLQVGSVSLSGDFFQISYLASKPGYVLCMHSVRAPFGKKVEVDTDSSLSGLLQEFEPPHQTSWTFKTLWIIWPVSSNPLPWWVHPSPFTPLRMQAAVSPSLTGKTHHFLDFGSLSVFFGILSSLRVFCSFVLCFSLFVFKLSILFSILGLLQISNS